MRVRLSLRMVCLKRAPLASPPQVRDLLEGLSDRLASQQELLLRLEAGSGPAASGASSGAGTEALAGRRDLLAQALEKLQVGGYLSPSFCSAWSELRAWVVELSSFPVCHVPAFAP